MGLKLSDFAQPADHNLRADPFTWPLCGISADRGSPGVSALQFLQRVERLNVDEHWDLNHGAWDSEKTAIADVGDRPWLLLMLMTVNAMSGPWSSDARFQRSWAAMCQLWQQKRPHDMPLFMAAIGPIADELSIPRDDPGLPEKAWNAVLLAGPLGRKGYICNLNRFYGFIEVGLHELVRRRTWHQLAFITAWVARKRFSRRCKSSPVQSTRSDRSAGRARRRQLHHQLTCAAS